jgi:serine/threonine protein kinase
MDPCGPSDAYRLSCFNREPEIVRELLGKNRCLQLVEGLNTFKFEIEATTGDKFELKFDYFSTDYICDDIDDYFLAKEDFSPIEKLKLFKLIVNAVEAIHKNYIFHRDLKPDNIRAENTNGSKCTYVIDFGTAARFDSSKLISAYSAQVGASLYSAPETFLGFAGERDIAKKTDFYALGCMLYELFNKQIFFNELLNKNPTFLTTLTALAISFSRHSELKEKLAAWDDTIEKFSNSVKPPAYQETGCTLPVAISGLIIELFKTLTEFDFNKRMSNFEQIRKTVDTAILVLRNEAIEQERLQQKRIARENKLIKIKGKEDRLNEYLQSRARISC